MDTHDLREQAAYGSPSLDGAVIAALTPAPPAEKTPQGETPDGEDGKRKRGSDKDARIFPHNLEAERALLGGVLLENERLADVLEVLTHGPAELYREAHRKILTAMVELQQASRPIDLVTLAEHLDAKNQLGEVGAIAALSALPDATPVTANLKSYASIIHRKYVQRMLLEACGGVIEEILAGEPAAADFEAWIDGFEERLMGAAALGSKPRGAVPIGKLLEGFLDRLDRAIELKQSVTGLPTGLDDLDQLTAGWQDTDLIILAARPSMGKTALVLNFLHHLCVIHRVPAAIFSLEMSREQLVFRLVCMHAKVDATRVRTGAITSEEHDRIIAAVDKLYHAPLYIDDTASIDINRLKASARRLQQEKGIRLLVVDYLQLMGSVAESSNRNEEVSKNSRGLKLLAKELRIPVIALSQLNRDLEKRTDKRPNMSDLRDSGAIEQDADLIGFLYREWVYKQKTMTEEEREEADEELKRKAEIIIAKHRNGGLGTIEAVWLGEYGCFANVAKEGMHA